MALDHHNPANGSRFVTLGNYVTRYRTAFYVVFATAISLSVIWNWNWLTGAEVFRILAALPCTLMMLMCLKRGACRPSSEKEPVNQW